MKNALKNYFKLLVISRIIIKNFVERNVKKFHTKIKFIFKFLK